MSAKPSTSQKPPADIALIVFGADRSKKPCASRFPAANAAKALELARHKGLRTLKVTDRLMPLARRLPKGKLTGKGNSVIPLVRPALYAEILSAAGASPPPASPPAPSKDEGKKPDSASPPSGKGGGGWDNVVGGQAVLAHDPTEKSWFEANIQKVEGDTLTLTWRDYPNLGTFSRKITQLALLHPKMVKPC